MFNFFPVELRLPNTSCELDTEKLPDTEQYGNTIRYKANISTGNREPANFTKQL